MRKSYSSPTLLLIPVTQTDLLTLSNGGENGSVISLRWDDYDFT